MHWWHRHEYTISEVLREHGWKEGKMKFSYYQSRLCILSSFSWRSEMSCIVVAVFMLWTSKTMCSTFIYIPYNSEYIIMQGLVGWLKGQDRKGAWVRCGPVLFVLTLQPTNQPLHNNMFRIRRYLNEGAQMIYTWFLKSLTWHNIKTATIMQDISLRQLNEERVHKRDW